MKHDDKYFLERSVKIAFIGIENGGGPFGAVVAREGEIFAEAFNRVVLDNDPTSHAEILAIRKAASKLGTHDLSSCILYTSCEPCPMCLGAIYWAGIKKVFYAYDRKDAEKAGFSDKLIYDEISLDPSSRKISFIKLNGQGGDGLKDVFKAWDNLENKTPY